MAEIEDSQENREDFLEEEPTEKRPYYFQLDVLKAIAIAFVVMDHSLTWEVKGALGNVFWERLSIPFFLLVMGFNLGLSFKHREAESLRDLYTGEYFKRRFKRYVIPFLILYAASILLGTYFQYLSWDEHNLLGYLPFWGPGNWFIALLFGSIVIFPLVYWAFNKHPALTVVLCFLSEIILQLVLYLYFPYPYGSELEAFIVIAIRLNVLFYLPAVGLGLWFSRGFELGKVRNFFIFVYAPLSALFMFDYQTWFFSSMTGPVGQFFIFVNDFIRGDYTFLFYGYAAFLFLLAMSGLPSRASGKLQGLVQDIGRASYHILLFQICYMSVVYWLTLNDAVIYKFIPDFAAIYSWPTELYYIPFYLMNLTFAFAGGLLWYYSERWIRRKRRG